MVKEFMPHIDVGSVKEFCRLCPVEKVKKVASYFPRLNYKSGGEYPDYNVVIIHATGGQKPAYMSKNYAQYPALYIYDDGKRCYGVKSIEVLFLSFKPYKKSFRNYSHAPSIVWLVDLSTTLNTISTHVPIFSTQTFLPMCIMVSKVFSRSIYVYLYL